MKRGQIKKTEIHRRRKRRKQYRRLRAKLTAAKTETEKKKILEKVKRIAPWLPEEEFLATLKKGK